MDCSGASGGLEDRKLHAWSGKEQEGAGYLGIAMECNK